MLRHIASNFPRSPQELNALLESDAELVSLGRGMTLAITADTIVEEIETGLYADPFQIGWIAVMANLSDLAAVGARPLGLVLIEHLPTDLSAAFLEALQRGIAEACLAAETYVLGGDTNTSSSLQIGAAAVGLIEGGKIIMRRGLHPGDKLFASSYFGEGNAYAFSRFFERDSTPAPLYQPRARLREGVLVRQYGSACIDTSDGFFPALANLIELNDKGFSFRSSPEELISEATSALAREAGIPAWFFLAGPHGEFELLFTIPRDQEAAFLRAAGAIGWEPLQLATVIEAPELYFPGSENSGKVDPFLIANLFSESGGQPASYFVKLRQTEFYENQDQSSKTE